MPDCTLMLFFVAVDELSGIGKELYSFYMDALAPLACNSECKEVIKRGESVCEREGE